MVNASQKILKTKQLQKGFTLIELMIVVCVFAILTGMIVVTLLKPQTQISLDSTVETVVADLKSQQLKSMLGDKGGGTQASPFGVYFDSANNRYVLFRGTSYSAANSENFNVSLTTGITFSVIPFTSGGVVFNRRNGEVANFINGQNTLTIQNTTSGEQKTLTISKYGVITVN